MKRHHLAVVNIGEARSVGGALRRGILRLAVLLGLALVSLSWAGDEEAVGNRVFLWSLAGLLFVVAVWSVIELLREMNRLQRSN